MDLLFLDGYIPFVKRNNMVSIGKNTYGTSISASLKTMYALEDYTSSLTVEGIFKSIKNEIYDELKIDTKYVIDIKCLAAYRDIVEGNKPQFLVLAKVNRSRDEIINDFTRAMKKKHKGKGHLTKEEREQEDGNNLIWFTEEAFKAIDVFDNRFESDRQFKDGSEINQKMSYKVVPSASASIYLTQKYLNQATETNH